jgi:hypothetical protein
MKKTVLRTLRRLSLGVLAALCIGAGIALYGWLRGWQTATQFSNALFVSGSAVIILGVLAIVGGFTSRGDFAITYSQSAGDASLPERTKQMMLDLLQGYNVLGFSGMIGVTLIGLSIFIYDVFG